MSGSNQHIWGRTWQADGRFVGSHATLYGHFISAGAGMETPGLWLESSDNELVSPRPEAKRG